MKIFKLYEEIMANEAATYPRHIPCWIDYTDGAASYLPEDFYKMAVRILEVAKSAFVPRGYNKPYGVTSDDFFGESVGAHTNLVVAIATAALDFIYDTAFGNEFSASGYMVRTVDGYSYREIIETILAHDLPENETGDLADNGSRDEVLKMETEFDYVENWMNSYPGRQIGLSGSVLRLFGEMQMRLGPTGRLIFLADKISAVIVTLALDKEGHSPMILPDDPCLSERDRREIKMCDHSYNGKYKASEMWTADYFKTRELIKYDDNLFFTALIVMTTLIVNGEWYSWREMDYLENLKK